MPAVRHPRLSAVAASIVLAILAAALLAGCGGTVIDKSKLDETTQVSLERSLHEKIRSVDCPSDLSVDPGTTFKCDLVFPNGKRDSAILKIRNKDADVSIVGLESTQERGE
jgi:Domain of unknown function (DUF4333)